MIVELVVAVNFATIYDRLRSYGNRPSYQFCHYESESDIGKNVDVVPDLSKCKYTTLHLAKQGSVVRKPINANPRLKVNRGFHVVY